MKVHGQDIEYSFGTADAPDRNWRDHPEADSEPDDDDTPLTNEKRRALEKLLNLSPGHFGNADDEESEETTVAKA